jgi:hypothetical protein
MHLFKLLPHSPSCSAPISRNRVLETKSWQYNDYTCGREVTDHMKRPPFQHLETLLNFLKHKASLNFTKRLNWYYKRYILITYLSKFLEPLP